jgi:hypothetical protein
VAFILLTLVRTLRSNLHCIHKNLTGALFFSQLIFVVGINRTENPVRPVFLALARGVPHAVIWLCLSVFLEGRTPHHLPRRGCGRRLFPAPEVQVWQGIPQKSGLFGPSCGFMPS